MHDRRACVLIGFSFGIVGMMLFGIYHWFYVAPVVAVFLEGVVWGGGAGALVGLAYHHAVVVPGRRGIGWDFLFGVAMVGALTPYEAVGLIWGPFEEITRPEQILPMLPITLVGVPFLAVAGWLLTRSRRGTGAFVLAGFVLHFFIGGSAAHFGGRGQTLALVLLMGGFELLAALAFGPLLALARRFTPTALPPWSIASEELP